MLIHGFGASTHDFEEFVLEPLARPHRVVALDHFGHGWSERRDDFAYGWTLWSEEVAGTLDALGIPRAAVLGHSMGGAVAAVLAARHPDKVERLILADGHLRGDGRAVPAIKTARVLPLTGDHFPFRDDVASFLREVEAFLAGA